MPVGDLSFHRLEREDARPAPFSSSAVVISCAALWTIPFLCSRHRLPLATLDSELLAQACLGLLMLSCGLTRGAGVKLRWPLPALLVAMASLAILHQALHHLVYAQQWITQAWFAACMMATYVAGRQIVALGLERRCIQGVCTAVLATGIVSVAFQCLQLFEVQWLPDWVMVPIHLPEWRARPFANFAQTNLLATYLAIAMVATLYLGAKGLRKLWVVASMLLLTAGLGMTGSRIGLIHLATIGALLTLPNGLRPADRYGQVALAVAAALGYVAGIAAVRIELGTVDINLLARLGQDSYGIRLELWKQAWAIALHSPWLGAGPGQFPAEQYWVAQPGRYAQPDFNCHNLVLQLAAELGWPLALSAVALGAWWLFSEIRSRLQSSESAFAWVALALIGIYSLIEFPLWYLHYAIAATWLFAIAEPSASFLDLTVRRLLPVAGIGALLIAAAVELDFGVIARASENLRIEQLRHQPLSNATESDVIAASQSRIFRPQAERLFLAIRQPPDQTGPEYVAMSERVLSRIGNPDLIVRHIILLAQAGRTEESIRHVSRLRTFARDAYPKYRDLLIQWADAQGEPEAELRRALVENP